LGSLEATINIDQCIIHCPKCWEPMHREYDQEMTQPVIRCRNSNCEIAYKNFSVELRTVCLEED
jgi:hypothetical protein